MVRVYLMKSRETGMNHRQESEQARRLLERILSRKFPEVAAPFSIEKTPEGKPYLPDYPHICFNLSHSSGYIACAIGDKPVGIDVEVWKNRRTGEKVVKKFHPLERELYENTAADRQQELFYRLWVFKESFVKAMGEGLRIPLDSFCLSEDGKTVCQSRNDRTYYYRAYEMDRPDCSLAVCSEESVFADEICWLFP
jgi:4'-phosphopantetheinyl transferase